jgi:hypothetical protein
MPLWGIWPSIALVVAASVVASWVASKIFGYAAGIVSRDRSWGDQTRHEAAAPSTLLTRGDCAAAVMD